MFEPTEESMLNDILDEIKRILDTNKDAKDLSIQIKIVRNGGEPKVLISHLVTERLE